MSVFWKGMTTRGAFIGGFLGLFSAVGLVVTGPTVWVKVLGNAAALQPTTTSRSSRCPSPSSASGSSRSWTVPPGRRKAKDSFEAQLRHPLPDRHRRGRRGLALSDLFTGAVSPR